MSQQEKWVLVNDWQMLFLLINQSEAYYIMKETIEWTSFMNTPSLKYKKRFKTFPILLKRKRNYHKNLLETQRNTYMK